MLIKAVVILLLVLIIGSLFSGLLFMFRDKSNTDRMVKTLTIRIGLSIFLFVMLMAGFYFGLIPGRR